MGGFFDRRLEYYVPFQENYLDLNPQVAVNIVVNDPAMGGINVNCINLADWVNADGTWNARYYLNFGLPMTTAPNVSYEFSDGKALPTTPSVLLSQQ